MVAVLKAGGAFVSIDPNHPADRQSRIVLSSGARLVLMGKDVASANTLSWSYPVVSSFIVSAASLSELDQYFPPSPADDTIREAQHNDAAYIVYTSGSTGTPKGIVVSHGALCTSVGEQTRVMTITPSSRVLQYAAYTFDVSVGDIFAALTAGACLCIPSESARRDDLAQAMTDLRVTHACLTSTVAGTLEPDRVPTLRVLTLGGEPMSKANIVKWSGGNVKLNNIYGPAECTVWCFSQRDVVQGDNEAKIGFGMRSKGWIVHPEDSDRLMPVGAVGELVVEGPLLAQGYLDDEKRTAAAFIVDPAWRALFGPEEGCRLYKTGDLVRYDVSDGGLIYVGRKDTQVKVRGQRIELGEIEHHLKLSVGAQAEVVVDLVKPSGAADSALAAFVAVGADGLDVDGKQKDNTSGVSAVVRSQVTKLASRARRELARHLPPYMVPTFFVPLRAVPQTVSGKTDRKKLRELCARMRWSDLISLSSSPSHGPNGVGGTRGKTSGVVTFNKTGQEAELAEIWSQLLGIPASDIGPKDSFLALGGDSLKAIQLAAALRGQGRSLRVAQILENPRLSDMAPLTLQSAAADGDTAFTVPDDSWGSLDEDLLSEASLQCGAQRSAIVGIYPCTSLQERMMESSLQGETTQFAHEVVKLWPSVSIDRFKAAWADVVRLNPILRTRFVRSSRDGRLRQAVLDEDLAWEYPKDFEDYLSRNFAQTLQPGSRLGRWALWRDGDSRDQMLAISLHHSLFDGITLVHIFSQLHVAYRGGELPRSLPAFGAFLNHIRTRQKLDHAGHQRFWRKYLSGWQDAGNFPRLPHDNYRPNANGSTTRLVALDRSLDLGNITLSTLVRGAWSLLLLRKTRTDAVLFGSFLAGRSVDVPGIESLVAPTFVHVPILARMPPASQTTRTFLAALQADAIAMIPFEHTGMDEICRAAGNVLQPHSLLVVQPMPSSGAAPPNMPGENGPFPGQIIRGPRVEAAAMGAFNWSALLVECTLTVEGIAVRSSFDDRVIAAADMEILLDEFACMIKGMRNQLDRPLAELVA